MVELVILGMTCAAVVGVAFLVATSDPAPKPVPQASVLLTLLRMYEIRSEGVQDYMERLFGLYQGLKGRVLRLETGLDWLMRETGKTPPQTWKLTYPTGAEE